MRTAFGAQRSAHDSYGQGVVAPLDIRVHIVRKWPIERVLAVLHGRLKSYRLFELAHRIGSIQGPDNLRARAGMTLPVPLRQ